MRVDFCFESITAPRLPGVSDKNHPTLQTATWFHRAPARCEKSEQRRWIWFNLRASMRRLVGDPASACLGSRAVPGFRKPSQWRSNSKLNICTWKHLAGNDTAIHTTRRGDYLLAILLSLKNCNADEW